MTIMEAINQIDGLKANTYSVADKVTWLSRLDGMIKQDVIDTHECGERIVFVPYTTDDVDDELLVDAPHDEMYIRWLEAQIDYANGEYSKYNNSITMFNTAYNAYQNWYNRHHMPKSHWVRFK